MGAVSHPSNLPHPNVTRYWQLIEAFNSGDLNVVAELLDHDIVYTIPGRSPIAGQTRGVRAHIEALRFARERSEGTLRLEPRAVVADDEYLFVYGRITARRRGKVMDSDHCVVFRFSDGRIVEGRTVPLDLYAFDEFWA
jgi:ketosteroid isomerase-like protein